MSHVRIPFLPALILYSDLPVLIHQPPFKQISITASAYIGRSLYDERFVYSYWKFNHMGVEVEGWVEISKLGNLVELREKKPRHLRMLSLWLCKL